MILKNGLIYTENGFEQKDICIRDGKFDFDLSCNKTEILDLTGKYVIPGLIDIHGHGNSGYDFSTCDLKGLKVMAAYLAQNGITSFAPASMTVPYTSLEKAYSNALSANKNRAEGEARVVGVHMEGPFFSYGKRGAQNPDYLLSPQYHSYGLHPDVK